MSVFVVIFLFSKHCTLPLQRVLKSKAKDGLHFHQGLKVKTIEQSTYKALFCIKKQLIQGLVRPRLYGPKQTKIILGHNNSFSPFRYNIGTF